MIELYQNEHSCCGCGICAAACPTSAISMQENLQGFVFPVIDTNHCIQCGKCTKICAFQNDTELNIPLAAYAAVGNSPEIIHSSSGGVFACLANVVIENKGIVFGAATTCEDDGLCVHHCSAQKSSELSSLQGSKYVQSNLLMALPKLKQELSTGRLVLFSGTPCQVDAVRSFLGHEYENLWLVDIICHGVPSAKMFREYLVYLENKWGGKIKEYLFRDKSKGWSYVSRIRYQNKKGKVKTKYIHALESSYYHLFLNSTLCRESCYHCKYAHGNRPGDITLGDFWGIEYEHKDYLKANGGMFDEQQGISCALINSEKGKDIMLALNGRLTSAPSTFEKIAKHNGQLKQPTKRNPFRQEVFKLYVEQGYPAVAKWFYRSLGIRIFPRFVIHRLPSAVKKMGRRILARK